MPLRVVGNLLLEQFYKFRALGPRAHKCHLAPNDIYELRQFVDSKFADDSSNSSDTRIIFLGPFWTFWFGIDTHRAELHDCEDLSALTDPTLSIKDRARGIQLDCHRGNCHQRQGQQQPDDRKD